MDLVIFDLETTGLSPSANDIIQIAAVRISGGAILSSESFSTFVNPGYRIPPFIASYTGVTDAHVRNAPPIKDALPAFSRFVGDSVLVAHNGHRFDMPFVHEACVKCKTPTRSISYSDSIYLSKRVWKDTRRHSLDAVLQRLEMSTEGVRRHDARGDVALLAMAVIKMWTRIASECTTFPAPTFTGKLPKI